MARLSATFGYAAAIVASGKRVAEFGPATSFAAKPWAPLVPLPPDLPQADLWSPLEARVAAGDSGEGDAHVRTSRHLAEVLGLRTGAAGPAAPQAEEEKGEEARDSQQFAELLGRLVGAADPAGPQGDDDDDGHGRRSRPSVEVLGFRGGACDDWSSQLVRELCEWLGTYGGIEETKKVPTPMMQRIWPLMQRADVPLRVGLMSWAIYDKLRRVLKHMAPEPFFDNCEEFFRIFAGIHHQVLDFVKETVEIAARLGPDDPVAREAYDEALKYLALEMRQGVASSAFHAVSMGMGSFLDGIAIRILASRMVDFAQTQRKRRSGAARELVALSGRAASEASSASGVTHEFFPERVLVKTRLKLLGLIASLAHESFFEKAQEALGHNMTNGQPMSLKEFRRKMGVNRVGDLVKRLVRKYTTPDLVWRTYLALYTIGPLRNDPSFFQIFWTLGLLSRFLGSHVRQPAARVVANYVLYASLAGEAGYRSWQFAEQARLALAGVKLGKWGKLLAVHGYLTLMLFVLEHPHKLLT